MQNRPVGANSVAASQVLLLVCLKPAYLEHLSSALGPSYLIRAVDDWRALRPSWSQLRADALVLDPCLAPEGTLGLAWAAGLATLLYTTFTPAAIRRSLAVSTEIRSPSVAIVLHGHDDDRAHLRALVDQLVANAIADVVGALLAPHLADVPGAVRAALLTALAHPMRFPTVDSLADAAGVPAPMLRRWTRRAHIASPKLLLTIGRLVWAYHHIRVRAISVHAAALRLGYDNPRDLSRHMRRLVGTTPIGIRDLEQGEFVARLGRHLFRKPPC